jgi:hypothetical protein
MVDAPAWGIWLKRAQRVGQREYRKMYGWIDVGLAKHGKFDADVAYSSFENSFKTREEAESVALILTARHSWLIGWLEIRPFTGYAPGRSSVFRSR